tara:strand:+ start:530 stop:655 length:126 start_codon:yes stop_codon:yes gene_type:complete
MTVYEDEWIIGSAFFVKKITNCCVCKLDDGLVSQESEVVRS